ncbi:MAG TPA: nitroreductase family protein [Acidimicrobiales bacterium]|nr:nitroreductase family protein [Acidimicrobiales bacterium]
MSLNLKADEVLATTRAVRKRLDFDRPVERSLIEECLDLAIQAPTGSNRQTWHFMLVGDPDRKARLAELYRSAFEAFYASGRSTVYPEGDLRAQRKPKVLESAAYLTENFHRAPWILIPCQEGRVDGAPAANQAGWWGSIVPAVWSFMLAARERGLGTAWTTMHLAREREAAEILGIPYDRVTQVAMIPVAHTVGTDFKPAPRLPLDQVAHWEMW